MKRACCRSGKAPSISPILRSAMSESVSVPLSRKGERTGVRRARLYAVGIRLGEPFGISGGRMTVRRSLIVELTDEAGNRGYGESAPFEFPFYSSETFASARACLVELLLPEVVGAALTRPQ